MPRSIVSVPCAMQMRAQIACIALLLAVLATADEQVRNGLINCRPAMFGVPNYLSTISGTVVWATPGDRDGCAPIDKSIVNWPSGAVIVMVDRGNCSFVQKVRNCEYAGAAAAIVVDNIDEYYLPYMADDGSGRSINVPSVLIHKFDGQKIKSSLQAGNNVQLSMTWSLPEPDGRVEASFWTSSENDDGNFKHTFGPAVTALDYHVKFSIRQIIYDGTASGCRTSRRPCKTQCTNDDRYCVVDPEHDFTRGLNGSDCVRENLRQLCLLRYLNKTGHEEKWWNYASRVLDECGNTLSTQCSYNLMTQMGFPVAEIQKCIRDAEPNGPNGINRILEAEMDARYDYGIFWLPTLTVNDVPYRGSLSCPNPSNLQRCGPLNMICQGFLDGTEPDACFSDIDCPVGQRRDVCGQCGGSGSFDVCGRCYQSGDPRINSTCRDCTGTPNGHVQYDECHVCGGTGTYDACGLCLQKNDRRRVDFGKGGFDSCGNCMLYTNPLFNQSCAGCDGVPNSGLVNDPCGVCGGTGSFDVCGYCYAADDKRRIDKGKGSMDACGNCLLYSSPAFNKTCSGCDGVPNSGKVVDVCGLCGGKSKVEDCKVTEGGSFPVGGTIAIVGGSVVAVGGAVFCYMRRRENKMKSDIDSLLRQYLPLDGGVGINSQARETAAAEAHRNLVDTASVDSEAGP